MKKTECLVSALLVISLIVGSGVVNAQSSADDYGRMVEEYGNNYRSSSQPQRYVPTIDNRVDPYSAQNQIRRMNREMEIQNVIVRDRLIRGLPPY